MVRLTDPRLIAGAVVGAGALGFAAWKLYDNRQDDRRELGQQQARVMPVDEFVSSVMTTLDRTTNDRRAGVVTDWTKGDGVISRYSEEVHYRGNDPRKERTTPFAEATGELGQGDIAVARAFLTVADTDKDGFVTRDELAAEVKKSAGDDGKLDLAERREVLADRGLADHVRGADFTPWRSGYYNSDSNDAYQAVEHLLGDDIYSRRGLPSKYDFDREDEGVEAVPTTDEFALRVPHTTDSGPIVDHGPWMRMVDTKYGNGNGLLSKLELARWVSDVAPKGDAPRGYVSPDVYESLPKRVEAHTLGRVDGQPLAGKLHYNDKLDPAVVKQHYGGDLKAWLEEHTKLSASTGVEWTPDPGTPEGER